MSNAAKIVEALNLIQDTMTERFGAGGEDGPCVSIFCGRIEVTDRNGEYLSDDTAEDAA